MIRQGGLADVQAVLGMFDSAVAWLTERGRTGQWGSAPFSTDPARIESITRWASEGGMRIAEIDGEPAGCVVVGAAMPYVPPPVEPELYVHGLVIDKRFSGQKVGAALLGWAREEAARRGVGLLRVDCYAGDDGKLVKYYESMGFSRTDTFTVGEWPGQVLEMRISPADT
ncbi:GNAT family N-acetyltransferase [Microtetraspora sp. NBRC 16547]|uniref:GNAT family N-acetyltransferase n=1 Tax=Microtetraspora sp. NBRC 16547 TaxID=3030993 RepID=UPI0025552763|nr:GNAT family N-acetyltransferase [Microtetraspora sp. NBRC 16547]